MFTVTVLLGNVAGFVAGLAFFKNSAFSDPENNMYTICQLAGLISMTLTVIAALCVRHRIKDTIDRLLNIYDKSKNIDLSEIKFSQLMFNLSGKNAQLQMLMHANDQSDWFCKMYIICEIFGCIATVSLMSVGSILIWWFRNESAFDVNRLYHVFNVK